MTVLPEVALDLHDPVYTTSGMPEYGVYDREAYIDKLVRLSSRLIVNKCVSIDEADRSLAFAEQAFDRYEGKEEMPHEGSFTFMVPTRIDRQHGHNYKTEITPFLPIVRGLNNGDMLNAVVGLPPSVIDSYHVDDKGRQGHVLFVPLFKDMLQDMDFRHAAIVADKVINDAADFAKNRLGSKIAGLGATLPLMTRYGKSIRTDGLETTTGHGGTVWLIGETVQNVIESKGLENNTIGIIGAAGSIGSASLDLLLEKYPTAHFLLQDTRDDALNVVVRKLDSKDRFRVRKADDLRTVLENSKVAVSAITEVVDLGSEYPDLDLDGVVIVDDSQPGAFSRQDVEKKGGKLVWVVGQDNSDPHRTSRMNGYLFGNNSGLMKPSEVWGCEGEVSSLAFTGEYHHAIQSRVTPQMARNIGQAMGRNAISPADFQSFGKSVEL